MYQLVVVVVVVVVAAVVVVVVVVVFVFILSLSLVVFSESARGEMLTSSSSVRLSVPSDAFVRA